MKLTPSDKAWAELTLLIVWSILLAGIVNWFDPEVPTWRFSLICIIAYFAWKFLEAANSILFFRDEIERHNKGREK